MLTVSVVMPAITAKMASKSLFDLVEFYQGQGNDYAARVCQAAIQSNAKAYKLSHKANCASRNSHQLSSTRVHFVTLTLDFENAQDGGKFIALYSKAIS